MRYAVWTLTNDEDWIKRNGTDGVLIAIRDNETEANYLADRLADVYNDPNVYVEEI